MTLVDLRFQITPLRSAHTRGHVTATVFHEKVMFFNSAGFARRKAGTCTSVSLQTVLATAD